MENKFNVWEFMVSEFGLDKATNVLNEYEESFGSNGLDYLWSLKDEDEVYDILNDFI